MSVEVDPFEDEAEEFGRVYGNMRSQGGFGRNENDPPFYVSFSSRIHLYRHYPPKLLAPESLVV